MDRQVRMTRRPPSRQPQQQQQQQPQPQQQQQQQQQQQLHLSQMEPKESSVSSSSFSSSSNALPITLPASIRTPAARNRMHIKNIVPVSQESSESKANNNDHSDVSENAAKLDVVKSRVKTESKPTASNKRSSSIAKEASSSTESTESTEVGKHKMASGRTSKTAPRKSNVPVNTAPSPSKHQTNEVSTKKKWDFRRRKVSSENSNGDSNADNVLPIPLSTQLCFTDDNIESLACQRKQITLPSSLDLTATMSRIFGTHPHKPEVPIPKWRIVNATENAKKSWNHRIPKCQRQFKSVLRISASKA